MSVKLLTNLIFEPKGKHDPAKSYTIKDTVMSEDGSRVYFALRDVPPGIQLDNTEYWICQIDLSEIKAAMEAAAASALVRLADEPDYLPVITNGHFRAIPYMFHTVGDYYYEVDGGIDVKGQRASSGKIPAPRNLCLYFGADDSANCYIYFYQKNDVGEYVVTFEPLKTVASNSIVNYVSSKSVTARIIKDIPDDMFMEICIGDGTVYLFGWDGKPFGMDVCATPSIPTAAGAESWMSTAGGSGITVTGKAKHIIADGARMRLVHGYKDGKLTVLDSSTKEFYTLPDGYDHFRIRIETNIEEGKIETQTGGVRDMFHIVAAATEERPISNAIKVIDNCRRACALAWSPRKNIVVNSNTTRSFKANTEYNGLIYSSQWDRARIVGWHVSPHTFLNAVNDEDSIMYNETADNGEGVLAPIYGTVCSAFATMCDGWECPQTNAGFFYDPDVEVYYAHKPQPGQIYTDIRDHCVIPCEITQFDEDAIVSIYEAVLPVSTKTTRFMSITNGDIWADWNLANGFGYLSDYGYVVHHPKAKPDMSTVPYADFASAAIINGSARPYKGDKSVYTSAEETVRINIKNDAAAVLYIESENGNVQQIQINGATAIDVKPYLAADGIYSVYTDADSVRESFEYVTAEPISYTISDGSIAFSSNEFWYANCNFAGNHYYQSGVDGSGNPKYEKRNVSVMANAHGDYSRWFAAGNWITSVNAIFRKGRYGAYTVPIETN